MPSSDGGKRFLNYLAEKQIRDLKRAEGEKQAAGASAELLKGGISKKRKGKRSVWFQRLLKSKQAAMGGFRKTWRKKAGRRRRRKGLTQKKGSGLFRRRRRGGSKKKRAGGAKRTRRRRRGGKIQRRRTKGGKKKQSRKGGRRSKRGGRKCKGIIKGGRRRRRRHGNHRRIVAAMGSTPAKGGPIAPLTGLQLATQPTGNSLRTAASKDLSTVQRSGLSPLNPLQLYHQNLR